MADRQADRLVEVKARKAAIKSGQIGKRIRHERRGPILTAIKSSVAPERQGEAFGIAASVTSAGFGVGPLGGGLLASSFGFGAPFVAPAVLLISIAALLWTLPRAKRGAKRKKRRIGRRMDAWKAILAYLISR